MNFKIRHDKKLVVIFSFMAILIFAGITFTIAANNNVFKGRVYFHTKLNTAEGLGKSHGIVFKGYEIGKVESFNLTKNNEIMLKFYIYKEYLNKMHKHSVLVNNFNPLSNSVMKFELIMPNQNYQSSNEFYKPGELVPALQSELGQTYLAQGIINYETRGVAGVVKQMNFILDQIIRNKTPKKLDEVVKNLAYVLETSSKTIESYNSKEGGAGSKMLIKTLKDVQTSVTYVRGLLKELHKNRKTLSPLILSTTKTLDKAQDTLDGINNNPLIRNGIKKRGPASIGVEISD